jgi:hypothetical protein
VIFKNPIFYTPRLFEKYFSSLNKRMHAYDGKQSMLVAFSTRLNMQTKPNGGRPP